MTAPVDQSRSPSLALVIRLAIERKLSNVHTGLPGEVKAFNAAKQTVDVQPLVQALVPNEDGTTTPVSLPVLSSLPVSFPAGGGMRMTVPLVAGDTGWILFSEASLDNWQGKGGITDPGDQRRFHLADAIFVPGLHADTKPLTGVNATDATFGKSDGHQVVVSPTAIELGGNVGDRPTDFVALASLAKAEISALQSTVNTLVSLYNTHLHPFVGVPPGSPGFTTPTTSSATPPSPVGEVKSAVVKSK